MLLLLTIIGMASMRGTSLQENMAGNLRESNLSFQAAEAGLRAGEQFAGSLFPGILQDDLSDGDMESGNYSSGFSDAASPPRFEMTRIAGLSGADLTGWDTSIGVPQYDGGVLVRIDSFGTGATRNESNQPVVETQLRSTYLLVED